MISDDSDKRSGFTVSDPERDDAEQVLPRIDFATFVLSLATSAMVHLGLVASPEGGDPPEPNRLLARQTIDTLEMLQEKTRGNLDDDEVQLLQTVLYELRMGFVKTKT